MLYVRKSEERGRGEHGWLSARHSFSFANYFDPRHRGFRDLLVINEDRVAPGAGFPTHPHNDMEIVTYIVDGELAHKDSLGTGSTIRPGEIQRMSAGTGIRHSEFNASADRPVHLLQIWIAPERTGIEPSYEQKALPEPDGTARLDLIGAREAPEAAVTIHQDTRLYRALVPDGQSLEVPIEPGRHAWVQIVKGLGRVNDAEVRAGDGVAASELAGLTITAEADIEALVFDLA
jgi:quercetin 2,3-dioxygenase